MHERTLLDDKSVLLCMQALLEVAATQSAAPRRLPTKTRLSRWFSRKRVSPENIPSAASLTPTLSRETTSLASSTTMSSENVSTAPSTPPPKPPKRSKSSLSLMFSKIGKKFNSVINRQGSKQQLLDDEHLISIVLTKKTLNGGGRLLMDNKDGSSWVVDYNNNNNNNKRSSPSLTINQSVLDTKEKEQQSIITTAQSEINKDNNNKVTEAQKIANIWREENAADFDYDDDHENSLVDPPSSSSLTEDYQSLKLLDRRSSQQEDTVHSNDDIFVEDVSNSGSVENSSITGDHDSLERDFSLTDFAHYNRMMARPLHDIIWQEKFHVEQKDEQKMYMTVKR